MHTPKGEKRMEITKQRLEYARTYVPLREKEAWVAENAEKCFDRLSITSGDDEMPPMYQINTGLKSRYLMQALAVLYFGGSQYSDEKDPAMMSEQGYDDWAGSHLFNQLERLKRDPEIRDKCFDLLTDFRDLEKRFSAQLNSLLAVQNDPVMRQSVYAAAQMKSLPDILAQIRAMQNGEENDGGESAV